MLKITTVPVKTWLAKSKIPGAGYVINPYVGCPHRCLYCYAAFMRKFTAHTEPWGHFLDVKLCEKPLSPTQLFHQHVMLSSVTDAYNPLEEKYQLTRRILAQLVQCQVYVSILTKSALVTRDIDLLQQLPGCEVAFSFSTVDETLRQQLEPGASSVQARLNALKTMHQAGLPTAVMAAPLLPGISNWKDMVDACAPYARTLQFDSLNMRATFQHNLMDFIDVNYPHLLPLYNEIYLRGKRNYWHQLQTEIITYCRAHHLQADVFFGKESSFTFAVPSEEKARHKEKTTAPPPSEPQLF